MVAMSMDGLLGSAQLMAVSSLIAAFGVALFFALLRRHKSSQREQPTNDLEGSHRRYAGRYTMHTAYDTVQGKSGVRYTLVAPEGGSKGNRSAQSSREVMILGGACSESFSGPNLAGVLHRSHEMERQALADLRAGKPASSLNTHTSVGLSPFFGEFAREIGSRAPWADVRHNARSCDRASEDMKVQTGDDWFVTLQVEGASAVHAAFDVLLQLRAEEEPDEEKKQAILSSSFAAIADTSYHGPGSTSFGSCQPLGMHSRQLHYPAPTLIDRPINEPEAQYFARKRKEFTQWLEANHEVVSVLFVEPQWGSSALGQPWPAEELRFVVQQAKAKGIKVCADEIMCGLGRHGKGTLFLSQHLNLDVDAVTFGKAIAGGVDPLSGCLFRTGGRLLNATGRSVMQSHTYAGSSTRALVSAVEVLRKLDKHHGDLAHVADVLQQSLQKMAEHPSLRGHVAVHGQGLLWGIYFPDLIDGANTTRWEPAIEAKGAENKVADSDLSRKYADWKVARTSTLKSFKKACHEERVLPYFVMKAKQAGCLLTPVLDLTASDAAEGVRRLQAALLKTKF